MMYSLAALLGCAVTKPIYDHHLSSILQLTNFNFDAQVSKIRQTTNYVSVVQFYKANDGKSQAFKEEFNAWSNQVTGIFRIGSVDCQEFPKLCQKEKINSFPTFVVYPPMPMPPSVYTGQLNKQDLLKHAARYLHSNVIEVHKDNIKTFLAQSPSVPKVLYFSQKKGVPMIYKGLSVAFQKKLLFGVIRSNETSLVEQYKVGSFPTILVVKISQKKPIPYKGEINFKDIFQFLNIYSEVFVPGGGSSLQSSATKPWMTVSLPELHAKSSQDICLSLDSFCVIYLKSQKPTAQQISVFQKLSNKYQKKSIKGVGFKFMYLNPTLEPDWAVLFGYQQDKVVIFSPSKRKRFNNHQGEINQASLTASIQKVVSGDARFNRLGDKLPEFANRSDI